MQRFGDEVPARKMLFAVELDRGRCCLLLLARAPDDHPLMVDIRHFPAHVNFGEARFKRPGGIELREESAKRLPDAKNGACIYIVDTYPA